ncbi:hypothetical protein PQ478_09180 [Alkalihalophilus pseudofirmus]|uniref:hypothetical protein n=1 Tax=Alkalihalophilus pseudofirmus TaxID=79885 RepID=UPI00259BB216|nr:hypothetical protein [Alkalihalophilus pseudofirmus]WEG18641.1 hypothetical protein PQ478_09180 [Alkalihalophilus pseudofirmus]
MKVGITLKLFMVRYLDDCDDGSYLTTGKSEKEVAMRETAKLEEECACFMYCTIFEISEVDGYEVQLLENN